MLRRFDIAICDVRTLSSAWHDFVIHSRHAVSVARPSSSAAELRTFCRFSPQIVRKAALLRASSAAWDQNCSAAVA